MAVKLKSRFLFVFWIKEKTPWRLRNLHRPRRWRGALEQNVQSSMVFCLLFIAPLTCHEMIH